MTIRLDFTYVLSWPYGMLRLGQIILCIIILICLAASEVAVSGSGFIYTSTVISLLWSLIILILYVLHVQETGFCAKVPWILTESVTSAIWAVCHVINLIIAAVGSSRFQNYTTNTSSCYGAAAFFCAMAFLAYVINAYLMFRGYNTTVYTSTAQRTVTVTTTTSRY